MSDEPTVEDTPTPLQIILFGEAVMALISLAITVTPSKTGSTWSFAELIWEDPTFLQKLLAAFVVTHILVGILGAGLFVAVRFQREPTSREP